MNELQGIITTAINEILRRRINVVFSWGLHNKRVISDGVRFDVQGFKFTGEVKVIYDIPLTRFNKELTFKVVIGEKVYTNIWADELIDFIDERV